MPKTFADRDAVRDALARAAAPWLPVAVGFELANNLVIALAEGDEDARAAILAGVEIRRTSGRMKVSEQDRDPLCDALHAAWTAACERDAS